MLQIQEVIFHLRRIVIIFFTKSDVVVSWLDGTFPVKPSLFLLFCLVIEVAAVC